MTATESTWDEEDCHCECHDDGGCPRKILTQVPTPMPADLIKISYLQLEGGGESNGDKVADPPILSDLDSLFPLLSNAGLNRWAKHVWGNWEKWGVKPNSRVRILQDWLTEIDRRFEVPSNNDEKKRVLQLRDGLGCVCRRDRPACDFQKDSQILLENYQIAHIKPVKNDGRDVWSNLALIRPRCNLSQGSKQFETWLKMQTRLDWRRTLIWPENGPKGDSPDDLISAVGIEWRPTKAQTQPRLPLDR